MFKPVEELYKEPELKFIEVIDYNLTKDFIVVETKKEFVKFIEHNDIIFHNIKNNTFVKLGNNINIFYNEENDNNNNKYI